MEVQKNGGFFDFADAENLFDDFFAGECGFSIGENLGDDFGDGSLRVAPRIEGVDAATDEDKTRIFDEFVVDGLDGDIFALEVGIFDVVGDIAKVHRLFFRLEYNKNFVADVFRVDGWPFGEAPDVVERGEKFRDRRNGFYVVWMLIIEVVVKLVKIHWLFVSFDESNDFVDFGFDGFFVAIFGNADRLVIFVVIFDDGEVGGDVADEVEGVFFFGSGGTVKNFLTKVGNFGNTTHFGEISDDNFFSSREFGNVVFFSANAEAN